MSPVEALRKLRAYPPAEWHWAFEVLAMLAWARFLIRFVPVRWWHASIGPIGGRAALGVLTPEQRALALVVRRWIARVSAHAPFRAVCLPQALAGRWMLARRGIETELRVGARPVEPGSGRYDLHAWLMRGELCLTGAKGRRSYSEFAAPTPQDLRRLA